MLKEQKYKISLTMVIRIRMLLLFDWLENRNKCLYLGHSWRIA
jgi:hypothetical protein